MVYFLTQACGASNGIEEIGFERFNGSTARVTPVFLKDDVLAIGFCDGCPTIEIKTSPGQADWDELGRHVHRAVNIGDVP